MLLLQPCLRLQGLQSRRSGIARRGAAARDSRVLDAVRHQLLRCFNHTIRHSDDTNHQIIKQTLCLLTSLSQNQSSGDCICACADSDDCSSSAFLRAVDGESETDHSAVFEQSLWLDHHNGYCIGDNHPSTCDRGALFHLVLLLKQRRIAYVPINSLCDHLSLVLFVLNEVSGIFDSVDAQRIELATLLVSICYNILEEYPQTDDCVDIDGAATRLSLHRLVCAILWECLSVEEAVLCFVELNGVSVVVSILRGIIGTSDSPRSYVSLSSDECITLGNGCGILSAVACGPRSVRVSMINTLAIDTLIRTVKCCLWTCADPTVFNITVVGNALAALAYLSYEGNNDGGETSREDTSATTILYHLNAVPLLISIIARTVPRDFGSTLSTSRHSACASAIQILANTVLYCMDAHCEASLDTRLTALLVAIMRECPPKGPLRRQAMVCLANLCRDNSFAQSAMTVRGGREAVRQVLLDFDDARQHVVDRVLTDTFRVIDTHLRQCLKTVLKATDDEWIASTPMTEDIIKLIGDHWDKQRYQNVINDIVNTTGSCPQVCLSSLSGAGLGVKLRGFAETGRVIAVYPGTIYSEQDRVKMITADISVRMSNQSKKNVSDALCENSNTANSRNVYWIKRDAVKNEKIYLDGRPFDTSALIYRYCAVEQHRLGAVPYLADSTWMRYGMFSDGDLALSSCFDHDDDADEDGDENMNTTCPLNPFACAHLLNHPPRGCLPNVAFVPYDVPIDMPYPYLIWNVNFSVATLAAAAKIQDICPDEVEKIGYRSSILRTGSNCWVTGIVLISLRDIYDGEEIFVDYNYNANSSPEVWYTSVDADAQLRQNSGTFVFRDYNVDAMDPPSSTESHGDLKSLITLISNDK